MCFSMSGVPWPSSVIGSRASDLPERASSLPPPVTGPGFEVKIGGLVKLAVVSCDESFLALDTLPLQVGFGELTVVLP